MKILSTNRRLHSDQRAAKNILLDIFAVIGFLALTGFIFLVAA